MAWPSWPIDEYKALARYVLPEMAERVRLAIVRDDEIKNGNRLAVVRAIYEALAACDFRYAREMYAPDDGPQLIRDPGEMLTGGGDATCLDLALLFAGVCLGHELLPLVVIVEGHAFVAVSLLDDPRKPDSTARINRDGAWVNEGVLLDGNLFAQLVAENGYYVPVECTGFAKTETLAYSVPEGKERKNGKLDFEAAIAAGRSQSNERQFRFAVDPALRQRVKKAAVYERHVDFGPQVFRNLAVELEHAERHPNRADLEAGAYFRNEIHHANIHNFLDTERRCLIVGKPGHGKTALAKAIGWEIMARDARQRVFYIQAGVHRSSERWLHHIKTFDHPWVTFILDDCHQDPLQVGALVAAWPDIHNARLLLVSWPLGTCAALAEEAFQEVLASVSVRMGELTEDTIGQIIERIVKRNDLAQRDPGLLQPVIARCRGDLHILEFLIQAWQTLPPGTALWKVPEEAMLESVYARYLGGPREPYRRYIAAVAALSQFGIPVESRWMQDEAAVAVMRTDSFVERFSELVDGIPLEFLRYFHPTPARYVVQAAYQKGSLRAAALDVYVLDQLANYIQYLPANLFDVFIHLTRGGHLDLQNALFAHKTVIDAVDRFVGLVRIPSLQWLNDFRAILYTVWRWEGDSAKTTRQLLQTFKARVAMDERQRLYRSTSSLAFVTAWLGTMGQLDPFLAQEMLTALDWKRGGKWFRDLSVGGLAQFFEKARKAGVRAADLNVFCSNLDLKSLGEGYHASAAAVRNFIAYGRRSGVSSAYLNTLLNALDLKGLGKRSRNAAFGTLLKFLELGRQIGASATTLNSFCQELDWRDIGRQLAPAVDTSPPLFDIHGICCNAGVTTEIAREFVEGLGWDAVRLIINAPSGPDIVAALNRLLVKKCGYTRKELAVKDVRFTFDTWLRSFVERPCSDVASPQRPIQSNYLRFALNGLRGYPPQALSERIRDQRLTLRQWNLLVRNVKLADAECCRTELEPMLRDMPQAEMTTLLRNTDLLQLSLFGNCFAPGSSYFEWRPRVDSDILEVDARAMIVTATALEEIAHTLFCLRYIGVPRWCAVFADVLDHEPTLVEKKLITADLNTVEFFLWNLLTARDSLHAPRFLSDDSIAQGILRIARSTSDQENLTAMCGTLHLWSSARLNELLPFLVEERVVEICEAVAKRKGVKLIRLAAGLAALRPVALPARSCEAILGGLAALHFPLNVPSQSLALERVRQWIGTPSSV